MSNLFEMEGAGFGLNGSIGSVGGGLIVSGDYVGIASTAGVGISADVSISPDATYTYITPIRGNVDDIGKFFKKLINVFLPKNMEI